MNREDLNRALERCESFTEYVLVQIAGYDKPWSTVAVVAILAFAMAMGGWLF